jgi:endonuclease-3
VLFDEPAEPGPSEELKSKALLVHKRLCDAYGCPVPYFHDLDPLSELVSSLLSHRTKNADSGRAFKELRARFPAWEQVRDAPTGEVQEAVAAANWPEQKAPRIQQVLRLISERRGELSLDFLRDLPPADAINWLRALPGVGPKTAAAVLSFSTLRMAALPVDCHHHRVARRLGLIGPKVDVAAAHAVLAAQLPTDFDAQQVYDNHEVMMIHGQRCCYHASPACGRCPVLELCPFGQARLHRAPEERPGQSSAEGDAGRLNPEPQDAARRPGRSRRR